MITESDGSTGKGAVTAANEAGAVGPLQKQSLNVLPSSKQKVIDFRARPPWKSLRKMSYFPPIPDRTPGATDSEAMGHFIGEMVDAGIDIAVAMGRMLPVGKFKITIPNDEIGELVQAYPDRFIGFGSLDVRDPRKAIEEVDHCVQLGLKGIAFESPLSFPSLHNDDASLFPIYEQCLKRGLVIAINCSAAVGPDISYADPVHIQRVGNRYPEANIVVTHAAYPYVTQMVTVAQISLLSGSNIYYMPDYALFNAPGAGDYIEAANFQGIYKRIIYGSSYPLIGLKEAMSRFRAFEFADANASSAILGGNASALLGL